MTRARLRHSVTVVLIMAGVALSAPSAWAQCPDGTPPPCVRAPTPNANIIAIVPFRVSGAERSLAYLRDGMAELLAVEFTGDGVPRAVEPNETLRAWSVAGGRRGPLSQAAALRVARELGAGQLLTGAVVGNAQRIIVTASILNVPRGDIRVASVTIAGSLDSLPVVVGTLSARLLLRGTGAWNLSSNEPTTTSNEAVKAYLVGQQARREGKSREAMQHLSRALDIDSTFVYAAYWLTIWNRLENALPNAQRTFRLAWRYRDRLGPEQRLLLEAVLGPAGPGTEPSRAALTSAIDQAAQRLPRSAEAWSLLGDRYFHDGALLGYRDWQARAKRALERAAALDTLIHAEHLATLAFIEGDATSHRQWMRRITTVDSISSARALHRYLAATMRATPSALKTARETLISQWCGVPAGPPWWIAGLDLPWHERDSLTILMERHCGGVENEAIGQIALNGGQGARAEAAWQRLQLERVDRDRLVMIWGENDSAAAERVALSIRAHAGDTTFGVGRGFGGQALLRCEVVLSRLRRGDTTGIDEMLAFTPRRSPAPFKLCATVARTIALALQPAGLTALREIDSTLASGPADVGYTYSHWNYDVAVAFARHGEWSRAAAAARRRVFGRPLRLPTSLRNEGRWAALAGDTVGAIEAYRRYLLWREDPEPQLRPQTDSVRAELAALSRPRRTSR